VHGGGREETCLRDAAWPDALRRVCALHKVHRVVDQVAADLNEQQRREGRQHEAPCRRAARNRKRAAKHTALRVSRARRVRSHWRCSARLPTAKGTTAAVSVLGRVASSMARALYMRAFSPRVRGRAGGGGGGEAARSVCRSARRAMAPATQRQAQLCQRQCACRRRGLRVFSCVPALTCAHSRRTALVSVRHLSICTNTQRASHGRQSRGAAPPVSPPPRAALHLPRRSPSVVRRRRAFAVARPPSLLLAPSARMRARRLPPRARQRVSSAAAASCGLVRR
jgi:hypothetical protein